MRIAFVTCLVLSLSLTSWAEELDSASLGLLTALRHAQRANLERHPQGRLTAEVREEHFAEKLKSVATLEFTWDRKRVHRRMTIDVTQPPGGFILSPKKDEILIETPRERIDFDPTSNLLIISPPGRFSVPDIAKGLPREMWYMAEFRPEGRSVYDLLDPDFGRESNMVDSITIEPLPEGLRFTRRYTSRKQQKLLAPLHPMATEMKPLIIEASMAEGGNVTLYQSEPGVNAGGQANLGRRASATWAPDGVGGFRLSHLRRIHFPETVDEPSYEFTMNVTSFDANPKIDEGLFSRSQFKLKDGGEIREYGNAPGQPPKVTRVGKAGRAVGDGVLKDLGKTVKAKGFADPGRR